MSSNTNPTENGEISQADARFIFECLKHLDENRQVALPTVATALGYTNVASAANRFRSVRKRYGFEKLDATCTLKAPQTTTTPVDKSSAKAPRTGKKAGPQTDAVENSDSSSAETIIDPEAVAAAMAKRSPRKTPTPRKGAKLTSKPVSAVESASPKALGHVKSEGSNIEKDSIKQEGVKLEAIDRNLIEAVNIAMEGLEDGDQV
ncbi:hypothetical protein BDV25DRAFT_137875 [Aspergillus avenaceus]|uniref:Myb-like DNA-binding domain-containing protein n=1 Tax=Aspergillus avenaceus TaxID=36643 RepID=A0A5N6U1G4_ASPAV|nr:hypothetical protein BDV25DRAFT_137875 [Aspergillus avenaceus]